MNSISWNRSPCKYSKIGKPPWGLLRGFTEFCLLGLLCCAKLIFERLFSIYPFVLPSLTCSFRLQESIRFTQSAVQTLVSITDVMTSFNDPPANRKWKSFLLGSENVSRDIYAQHFQVFCPPPLYITASNMRQKGMLKLCQQ